MKANIYKSLTALFAITLCSVSIMLGYKDTQLRRLRSDVRLARDTVWSIRANRDLALKAEPRDAAVYLSLIYIPEESQTDQDALKQLVNHERTRAVEDIIEYLRKKTAKDCGTNAQTWIDAFSFPKSKAQDGT